MKKIFLVDDSKFMRMLLKNIIEKNGMYIYGEAEAGQEAIDKLKNTNEIDLVILDMIMEDMKGIEAIKQMKKHNPNLKIIICSVMGQKSVILEAFSEGACGYITKPFTEYKLIKTIQDAI